MTSSPVFDSSAPDVGAPALRAMQRADGMPGIAGDLVHESRRLRQQARQIRADAELLRDQCRAIAGTARENRLRLLACR